MIDTRQRIAVALLSVTAAGFSVWKASEGDGPMRTSPLGEEVHLPYIPTKGDVPTIGKGSTRYEDGRAVKMTDEPITRARADQLARNLLSADEKLFRASLPGVKLHPEEYDLYMDFVGQYGIGNWRKSSIRTNLLGAKYPQACERLLAYRFQDGRDCSLARNWGPKGCKGVWSRQLARHEKCMMVQ